jgi:hypothetical protein
MWIILIPNEYIFLLILNSYVCRIDNYSKIEYFVGTTITDPASGSLSRQGHVTPWSIRRPLAHQRPEGTITTSQDKAMSPGTIFFTSEREKNNCLCVCLCVCVNEIPTFDILRAYII